MEYQSRAVRALVRLHDQRLRAFLPAWKEAVRKQVQLPASDNPNYQSLEAVLRHVYSAARGYLTWITESLELTDPGLGEVPAVEHLADQADAYLKQLLDAWGKCLTEVQQGQLRDKRHQWRALEMYVEAMLEHAVVHPERHQLQLQELAR